MPNARLVWVEECGHVPHLEQPTKTATEIVDFIKNGNPAKVQIGSDHVREEIRTVVSVRNPAHGVLGGGGN